MKKLAQNKYFILPIILNIVFLIVTTKWTIDHYGKSPDWLYIPAVVFFTLMIRQDIVNIIAVIKEKTSTNQSN